MKKIIIIMICVACLAGCRSAKTITVEVPVPVHDTVYENKEVHDSTYVDRLHTVYQKGDTVYDTKTITITKTVTKTDTARAVVERPITVTHTETVEVEKPLRWWQKGLMWAGALFLFVIVGMIVFKWLSTRKG